MSVSALKLVYSHNSYISPPGKQIEADVICTDEEKIQEIIVMCNNVILSISAQGEGIIDNFTISAGLIEGDVTRNGCDVLDMTRREAARYVRRHIRSCHNSTVNDVYCLLVEIPEIVH